MSVSTASETDRATQDAVEKELDWTRQVDDAANIGVAVHDGVVLLLGEVSSYAQKVSAAKAALRVRGVNAVANDIVVRYAGRQCTDAEIAEAARNTLAWTSVVPEESVKLEVRDRVVILSGAVEWDYQRRAARRAVENLAGVEGVFDRLILKPRVSATETSSLVKAATVRNAAVDASSVNVDVVDNKVILHKAMRSDDAAEPARI